MPLFRYRYVRPETGRLNTGRKRAFDEAHCRDLLAREGIRDVRDIVAEPDEAATDRQIAFLRDLGGHCPPGATKDEASDLISNRQRGREPGDAYERGLAAFYKVEVTRFASKHSIYKAIAFALAGDDNARDLVNWYVYRVYRTSFDRARGWPPITTPGHHEIRAISDRLMHDQDIVRSIRRECDSAKGWRWFGTYRAPDGAQYDGASRATAAYKTAHAALSEAGLVQSTGVTRRYVVAAEPATVEHGAVGAAPQPWWRRILGLG